jgi:hypothetical protein
VKPILVFLVGILTLTTPARSETADHPRNINSDGPLQGKKSLVLEEEWRVGGLDEDLIFGRIVDVKRHSNGNTYILDNQLCEVSVISPEGGFLGTLGRAGDGPGELRQPMGLAFLQENVLGIGMGFPGKIVALTLDGTPEPSLFPVGEPAEGNIGIMINAQIFDGFLVCSGGRMVFQGPQDSSTQRFLAISSDFKAGFRRILARETPLDPTGRTFDEAADYYPDRSYALGREGTIYIPMTRDRYEVSAYDPEGKLLSSFGRDLACRPRTPAEKDEVTPIINVNTNSESRDWKICNNHEAVTRVQFNPDDDTIWVLTPHGSLDQPDGVLETWDVFNASGEYLRQVIIPLGEEINDGNCYLVGQNKLVVVRGTGSSFNGDENSADEEIEEIEPLEVICYRIIQ